MKSLFDSRFQGAITRRLSDSDSAPDKDQAIQQFMAVMIRKVYFSRAKHESI